MTPHQHDMREDLAEIWYVRSGTYETFWFNQERDPRTSPKNETPNSPVVLHPNNILFSDSDSRSK